MSSSHQKFNLNERTCRKLEAPERSANGKSNNRLYWDSKCDGLALRVTSTDIRRFVVAYWIHGTERRATLKPDFPHLSPTAARKKAIKIRSDASEGIDILANQEEARIAPTVSEWCDSYLDWAENEKRPASLREDKRHAKYIKAHFSKTQKFRDITTREIESLRNKYKDKPRTANKILSLISHMFTIARKEKLAGVVVNPVFGIKRYKENERTRALESLEPRQFVQAIDSWITEIHDGLKDPANKTEEKRLVRQLTELRLFQFLLLTGARIGEASRARWADMDFDRLHGAIWTLPAHTTKTDNQLILDLGTEAEALLTEWRDEPKQCASELVFPGPSEDKPLTYPQRTWKELMKRAKLKDLRIHDLRHSNATYLLERGVLPYVIQQRLGHTSFRTTEKYLNPKKQEPMRDAAGIMGEHFRALKEDLDAEVTPIRKLS